MSFLKSVLFGCEGSYNIFGTPVTFERELPSDWTRNPPDLKGVDLISQLASKCINSNAFRLVTQGYIHLFIHEMSHALACKFVVGLNAKVTIFTSACVSRARFPQEMFSVEAWRQTFVSVAGPIGNIAFCACKLVVATRFKKYLSWPLALVLGSGAVIWMCGELLYAYTSASKKDGGDFGKIACHGNTHLALASTALIGQLALGTFAAIKLSD